MPLIRCSRCGQAYDVPGVIAIRLSNAIATCHCGEWLAGSKAAVLARVLNPEQIREIDLQPYRVDAPGAVEPAGAKVPEAPRPAVRRSIRLTTKAAGTSIDTVYTIGEHALWIGRRGCHVALDDAGLSLRHCCILVNESDLWVRDADSHMGTFLDGEQVRESIVSPGVHILRVGSALITIEPTDEPGVPVEPVRETVAVVDERAAMQKLHESNAPVSRQPRRRILVCIDGSLQGQEFEIPPSGLVVGREGHVRVPDEFLSRRHFEVVPDSDGAVRVRDLGSRNGTFLNTLPATNTMVASGDEIRAGVNRFTIEERD